MKVGLFIPCYIDAFFPQVGIATLELLERLGCSVEYPLEQTCCGQPMANSGRQDDAALPGLPPTAVMTTNTTQLTVDLATLAWGRGKPDDTARVRRRVAVTFPCVVGFVVGCAAGAVLEVYFGLWALALPVVLAALAVPLGELRSDGGAESRRSFPAARESE